MKKYLLLLLLFSKSVTLFGQIENCQKLYITNFLDENKIENEYTRNLTKAVVEAITDESECSVLDRSQLGTLEKEINNESSIQGMSMDIKKLLRAHGAERVLFGELTKTGPGQYELQLRIESLQTTQILAVKTADFTVNDLEKLSSERAIVAELIVKLLDKSNISPKETTPPEPIIKNVDNGLEFFVTDCIGNEAEQTVTVYFTFSNPSRPHQEVGININGSYGFIAPIAFAKNGDQFRCSSVTLAGEKNDYYVSKELPTSLRLNGSVTFSNVLPQTEFLELAQINVISKDFDGGGNQKKGTIEIKHLAINWRNGNSQRRNF